MAAENPQESLVGKTIDKCCILGKLGTGGMGSVYLAEHFGLNRKVALKILPGDMSRDPEYVARFMREATTAGRLEHPNIVQIHDVGYADSHHFIVMQFVDGESLSTVVDNLGALEPRDAAKVASGILRGLHHAHEQGVVHRDIKPDNVLIAKGDQPKLLDFGLAIETEASLHITKDGMVVGTPYYLSPEQARGHAATPQSDVYATGVTLYYLLTGKRPFTGATALAVLNKHINDAPVQPMTHRPDIPRAVNDIVLKMMAKKTEDRYKTAAAAADDLDRFLKGEEVADVLTWQMRLRGLTARQKLVGAGAGGAVLLLLLVLLIVALLPGKDPVRPPVAPPPPAAVIKENRALQELLAFERASRDSLDHYPEITGRFDDYLGANSDPALVAPAQAKLDEYRKHAGQLALQSFDKLPPASDLLARLEALEKLPKAVFSIKAAADRVFEERGRLLPLLEQRYAEFRSKLDQALASGEFDDARTLIADLLRFVGGERRAEIERIRKDLPEIEASFRDPLLQAYGPVRAEFEQLLVRRQVLKAYARVTAWVNQLDATGVKRARLPGVNYGMLLRVQENTVLDDAVLSDFRAELGGVWTQAQDSLAFLVLSDLQDALDLEWIIRRAGRALQALYEKRLEVTLATFGSAGKVGFGPAGFAFSPRSGPEKPFTVAALVPADLTALAAVADGVTPDDAFAASKPIVRAGGAAWYYSRAPERWPASVRWYAQAGALKAPGPPGRLRELREAGAQEVRRRLLEASKEKFDAARKTLDSLGTQWAHDPELSAEVSRSAAALLAAEFVRSPVAGQVALGRELREKHEGRYDAALVDPLYARALESTGRWDFVTPDLADASWTWDGKATGAPAPAVIETGLGFRPVPGRRLELAPVRLRTGSGLMFSVRLNEKKTTFFAGVELEGAKEGGRWRFGLREPGRLVLLDAEGSEVRSAPLEGFRPGHFMEFSFIAVGGDLFCFAEKKPLFNIRGGVRLDLPVAFTADAPVNIKGIELRK